MGESTGFYPQVKVDVAGTAAGVVADTTTTAARSSLPTQSLPSAGLPLGG